MALKKCYVSITLIHVFYVIWLIFELNYLYFTEIKYMVPT